MAQDGDKWRRVVASPAPIDIVEAHAIEVLLRSGILTICCGGGGIPVAVDPHKRRRYGALRWGWAASASGDWAASWRGLRRPAPSQPASLRATRAGVEAVVDKDAASALLATKLKADWLIMLTDADAVWDPTKWPGEKVALPSPISPRQLEGLTFASGSMGPKVQAAVQFVRATGGRAAVGSLEDAADIVRGSKGTVIAAD